MGSVIVVVVVPSREGSHPVRIVGEVFTDQSLLAMGAVEAFEPPTRFRMGDPRPNIARAGERDERPPFAADKLAAQIVDELRFTRPARREGVQRLLHGQHDEIRLHRHVKLPVDEVPAVPVQDVDEIVPARPNVEVHEVDVPDLIGSIRRRWAPQRIKRKRRPARH